MRVLRIIRLSRLTDVIINFGAVNLGTANKEFMFTTAYLPYYCVCLMIESLIRPTSGGQQSDGS